MLLQPKSFVEPETFHCRGMAKQMSVHDCIALYVNANALGKKGVPCHKCAQGADNRAEYSKS